MSTNPFALNIPPFAASAPPPPLAQPTQQSDVSQAGLWQRLQQEAQRRGISVDELIRQLQGQQGGPPGGRSYSLNDLSSGAAQPQNTGGQQASWGQVVQNLGKSLQRIQSGIGPQMFLPPGSQLRGRPGVGTGLPGSGAYTGYDVQQSPYDLGFSPYTQSTPPETGLSEEYFRQSPYDLGSY